MRLFVKAFCVLFISLSFVIGCAALQESLGTKTYVVTTEQVMEIKEMLHVEECPEGSNFVAFTVESAQGGAVLTVRCQ